MRPWRLAVVLGLLASALAPAADAQRGRAPAPKTCDVVFDNRDSTRMVSVKLFTGQYNTYLGGGVLARCQGSDQRIVSDSAEYYGDQGLLTLMGTVRYTEARLKVDANRMDYFTREERLVADGEVFARTPAGTTMRGPHAEYYRAVPGMRALSQLVATGRPVVKLSPDDARESKDTVDLVADMVRSDNDSLVYASGTVVISRPDLLAEGDSAFVDNGREFATLERRPRITGRGDRDFVLVGRIIDLHSRDRTIRRVVAKGNGKATSDDLELTADTLDMRFDAQKLQETFAFGPGRALAHSAERDIRADSIHVELPGQVLQTMHAVRNAVAESRVDSTAVRSDEPDWLRGDTITARFDAVTAPGDSVARTRIREVVAEGQARSFYQLAGKDAKAAGKPNINYVTGKGITVSFEEKQVKLVTVREQASGVYLEAVPDSAAARDSTATGRPPAPTAAPTSTPARRPR